MAISIDNLALQHTFFENVMKRSLPKAQVLMDQNMRSDYVSLLLRAGPMSLQLQYPLIVFHPNGDIEEYSELPYRFDLHDHGRSFIYTKNSCSWWSGDLTHTRSEDVPPTYRAFLLIL